MNKRIKLGKVVKRVQGYTIRLSKNNGFAIYQGKKLKLDRIVSISVAEETCEKLNNK